MEIREELKELANLIKKSGHTLYIVGGFVRDSILGLKTDDIDISSSMPHKQVEKVCKDNRFTAKTINKNLGTLQIIKNGLKLEYTQFRKESYSTPACHTPDHIEFVDDIQTDHKRRDLTINALYYDILSDKVIDLGYGMSDIKQGIIRTVNIPSVTLRDDGLRILRVIRFASTLNFKLESKTAKSLYKNKVNLNFISKERIQKEISQIVIADQKYNRANTLGLSLICKYGMLPYIFNSRLKSMKKITRKDIKDFYTLSSDSRLIGLYFLILKKYLKVYTRDQHLMFSCNMLFGLDGMKESKTNIAITEKLYRIYQNLTYEMDPITATINYLTLSNAEREIIDLHLHKKHKVALSDNISAIKRNNLPLSVHELPIKANDLIDAGIDNKYIGKILSSLYNQVLSMTVKNSKEDLITRAKEINETFLSLSKENKEDTSK